MKDACGIEDNRVSGWNELHELAKCSMLDPPRLTIHNHQAAFIAPLGRNLCYLVGREEEIVVIGSASVSDQKREGCPDPPDGIENPKCLYA